MLNKKKIFIIFIVFIAILFLLQLYHHHLDDTKMVMGGKFNIQFDETNRNDDKKIINNIIINEKSDVEKYFRPSKLPVLNDRDFNLRNYYYKEPSEITLPEYLYKTPEDTIINYFSILREAANPQDEIIAGCGTLGNAMLPYPIAYNFLSSEYQQNLTYDQYLETFQNILHINLIKLKKIPVYKDTSNSLRYFVEIETIKGSEKDAAYFIYYYGYVDILKEGNQYRISNLDFYGENYLCAPYHGWAYDAESVVDIKYGNWCSLVKKRYPTLQDNFVKKIYFKGTDGNDYLIEFYQLTNDTDIEIAQYMKREGGNWKLIKLDPNKCIENE